MSDSFWKKEISLGRKKPAEPDVAADPVDPVDPVEPKQSFLKKEISFGRKPKDGAVDASVAEPVAVEPKQSFLKKEISFGRKPKDDAVDASAAEPVASAEAKQSMWKKEISFGRKKQDKELDRISEEAAQAVSPSFALPSFAPAPPQADVPPTVVAEAVVAAMPEHEAPVEPVMELPVAPAAEAEPPVEVAPSFEPQPVDALPPVEVVPAPLHIAPDPPALVPDPVSDAVPDETSPFELAAFSHSLESVPDPAPWEPVALEAVPPEPEPEPGPVSVEPFPLETVPHEPVSLEAVPPEPEPMPVDAAAVESPSVTAVPELPFEPVPAEPAPLSTLSPAILAASAELPPAAPVEPAAPFDAAPFDAAPFGAAPFDAAPVEPASVPEPALAVEPDSWLAAPELPPDAVQPDAVQPEAVEPEAVEPVPVVPAPAEPAPVAVHPPVPASELPPIVAAKTPFWKKDLSLSRKKKDDFSAIEAAVAAAAVTGAVSEPKTPWWKKELGGKKKTEAVEAASGFEEFELGKKPFWKKDLSLSRKPKPAAAAVDAAVVAAAVTEATAVTKTPWWKKELGGKKKGAAPAVAVAAAPDVPKTAFWKKQLAMPSLSRGGGRTSGGGGKSSKGATKKLVGLKIGASQLAAARVSNNGVAELEQIARQDLPMGIVVGGELRDPDALSEALKAFFAKNKLPRKGVRLGIANNRIGVRVIDVSSDGDERQFANAIRFNAEKALPIPLDEAVLDYHVLDESTDPEGRSVKRVLLVVAYRELVERYVDACRKAGLTLAGIDLEAFALLRSLAPPTDRGTSALVAVSIGYDRSTFAVSDGQFCEFTRVLEWGGQSLNVALARAFNSEPSAVEAMKRGLSLDGSTAPEGVSAESNALAVDVVRKQIESFKRELVSSLQFYQNQPGSLGIGEIAITGGTAQMPGLAEELERLIGVHVRVGNPLARLKVAKRVAMTDDIGSYAVAIGLGIED
ncbi:MAG: type IV pilus assembly protein PilM [Gaiellaceae bacterium]